MKLYNLSEAKTSIGKPDIRHVHKVALYYDKFATNGKYATDRGERQSDNEIWSEGRPAIHRAGTIGEGFASLTFVFRDTPEHEAVRWVKSFISDYKIPYTNFETRSPRDLQQFGINDRSTYTRVIIKFEEHPDNA